VAWTAGRNVRFRPGAVYKTFGKTILATVTGIPAIRDALTFRGWDGVWRTVICCDTKIYSYSNDFGTVQDITPSPAPTSGADDVWQFAMVAGALVISNGVDRRWIWGNYSSVLQSLLGGPSVVKAMTTSMGRLMLGNIVEGGYEFIGGARWSEPGVPTNFIRDLEVKSGRKDLVNANTGITAREAILAFGQAGLRKIVYTDQNIWTGDPDESLFDYTWRIPTSGEGVVLVAPRAQVNVRGINYLMGTDDFHKITDAGVEGIGMPIQNIVFPNLNKSKIKKSFAFYKPSTREIYFCYPTGSNDYPDTAAILNLEVSNPKSSVMNWSFEDVDYLCHTYAWQQTAYTWDTIPFGSWDEITDSSWDEMNKTGVIPYEIVGNSSGLILKLDDGYNNNDVAIQGYIETGDFYRADAKILILQVMATLKPQTQKNAFFVQVGARDSLHHDIKWSVPKPIMIGSTSEITSFQKGNYTRLRFYTDQINSPWILEGFKYFHNELGGV
jgi:hypothetical protein